MRPVFAAARNIAKLHDFIVFVVAVGVLAAVDSFWQFTFIDYDIKSIKNTVSENLEWFPGELPFLEK